ncbi:hypothetical protein EJ08DRAFT_163617, partial [Tothia fuscella]
LAQVFNTWSYNDCEHCVFGIISLIRIEHYFFHLFVRPHHRHRITKLQSLHSRYPQQSSKQNILQQQKTPHNNKRHHTNMNATAIRTTRKTTRIESVDSLNPSRPFFTELPQDLKALSQHLSFGAEHIQPHIQNCFRLVIIFFFVKLLRLSVPFDTGFTSPPNYGEPYIQQQTRVIFSGVFYVPIFYAYFACISQVLLLTLSGSFHLQECALKRVNDWVSQRSRYSLMTSVRKVAWGFYVSLDLTWSIGNAVLLGSIYGIMGAMGLMTWAVEERRSYLLLWLLAAWIVGLSGWLLVYSVIFSEFVVT